MTAHSIVNLVKAISKPYPGAYLELNNEEFVVWKAALGDSAPENIEPGQVLEIIGQEVRVKCCAGSVWLLDHDINEIPSPGKYLL
jgi:methionyl-tRNA formyltransferase